MKVLVVEDDVDLLDLLTYALQREGYTVLAAVDGPQALARFEADQPDLVLLDLGLPKLDGLEVCRRIRHAAQTPIVMLTGRAEEDDVVRGLEVGADDYVTKPFSAKQLIARLAAVLRRCPGAPGAEAARELRVGDVVLDLSSHAVTKAGVPVQLTPLEFRILYMLALNAGRVVPYARLVQYAWGYHDEASSSLLKSHVTHLRAKLGLAPQALSAVVGVGYRLARPSAVAAA
jgi:DNA-binding response OmpR family regulator